MKPLATPDIGVVLCVERGVLEAQAVLLCQSLRAFGGDLAAAPIYALAPRDGHRPTRATIARLEGLQVEYIDRTLNTECVEYGSANRVAAAAEVERRTRHDLLAVLDSDTMFLAEPAAFALAPETVAAVRPVDVKGTCTSGPGDANDEYWQQLCACCGVDYDGIPFLTTSVDEQRVKACYNAGLVLVRADRGILERWWDYFLRSVRRGLRPLLEPPRFRSSTGEVPRSSAQWWGSNQAALSLALWSTTRAVDLLPAGYNYPLHQHTQAPPDLRSAALAELVHVHYHFMLDADMVAANPLLAADTPLPAAQADWLRARVPLAPPAPAAVARRRHDDSMSRQLIISGMHRSGTSLMASVLRAAGVDIGKDVVPGVGNPRGHFEDQDFHWLHEEMLAASGASWMDVASPITPPDARFVQRARELIAARAHLPLWGWKDPRTCVFLPFWDELLPDADYLFLYRHPVEVALSLWRRGCDPELRAEPWLAMRAWQRYNELLLAFRERHRDRCFLVHVPTATADLPGLLRQVASRFELPLRVDGVAGLFVPAELALSTTSREPLWEELIPESLALYRRLDEEADLPSGKGESGTATAGLGQSGQAGDERERDLWRAAEILLHDLLAERRRRQALEEERTALRDRVAAADGRDERTTARLAELGAALQATTTSRTSTPSQPWWRLRWRWSRRRD